MRKIYFAGSIRGGREDQALYIAIVEMLREFGEVLTEHVSGADLTVAGESMNDTDIHNRDLHWLRASDRVVAEVTTPSLGVGYEIGRAVEWGKPVLCLYRGSSGRALSAMIAGSDGAIIKNYETVDELSLIFVDFFS
ncbi:MAG: nucleoside 2-deoxyribosyltransferase [Acidobacteria bacterium]|nr:nucleoside 2-deoxyribosyltransferase [Acidobacteriota bacterium]